MGNRRAFDFGDLYGEADTGLELEELEASIRHLIDPAQAAETLHWGRNYLYRVELKGPEGPWPLAVKQFRNESLRARLERRYRGSKAARSWRMATAFVTAGVPTPTPVAWVESRRPGGPSFYVCEQIEGVVELRYLLRARNSGRDELYPWCDFERLFLSIGRCARQMHEAGLVHRDLSIGNVLVESGVQSPRLWLLDLNRARSERRPGTVRRARDLCRLELDRVEDQDTLLRGYWGQPVPRSAVWVYRPSRRGYRLKHRIKNRLRGRGKGPRSLLPARSPHAHIEPPPPDAAVRDRVVWDPRTDQPHQHAGRFERMRVRLADAPRHLAAAGAVLAASPRIWRRYRELARNPPSPRPWGGCGVGLRPWSRDPEALLGEISALGVRHVLLRLHPWQEQHREEEQLARALAERGLELSFALPQNRELVRDPERWQASVEEIAERFVPLGKCFQVGQAINRSKWGVWSYQEYLELAARAEQVLRRFDGVRIFGPAVIDFEPHATAAALFLPRPEVRFDGLASLLYVDRRGAPENRQIGLDTRGKVRLLRAVAEVAPRCGDTSWITEYNWPLWEGPHSPAGRDVAVDEETQASYLVRYLMETVASGEADRAYWWQMVAKGYGLLDPTGDRLRRRPAFEALAYLLLQLDGMQCEGALALPEPVRGQGFRRATGERIQVLWRTTGEGEFELDHPACEVRERDGAWRSGPSRWVGLGPAPVYLLLEE